VSAALVVPGLPALAAADEPWTDYVPQLWQALGETLYMVLLSASLTFVLGLLLGIALYVTAQDGLLPTRWVNVPIGLVVNISRSLPFLILLIVLIPVTRAIVGTSLGATAAIVPLTAGTAPFFGRVVETALREIDRGRIEAAQAMGATNVDVVTKVLLPEALPGLLAGVTLTLVMFVDYSAMAGAIGAGGLGTFAIKYGYQRFNTELMLATVVILVVIVQVIQLGGEGIVRRVARRR
jgi:D-methionine transport system permease protein